MAAAFDRVLKTQYFRYKLDPGSEMGEGDAMCLAQGEEPVQEAELYKVIQEKENDLVLAAELGKALLEKNEEISQMRERIVLDYTQKLEVRRRNQIHGKLFSICDEVAALCFVKYLSQALSQEKYLMSRQLERLEDEFQQEVAELQVCLRDKEFQLFDEKQPQDISILLCSTYLIGNHIPMLNLFEGESYP